MKTKAELPDCPVATTVSLIGSKWKLLILRNLLVRPWRFNELRKSLDGISQKVLTDSLSSMEEDGIITMKALEQAWRAKGINGWFDYWGYDVNHDWPWWKKQIRYFLPEVLKRCR